MSNKRFSYETVGYGVFTLLGEKYRVGRIEIYDSKNKSGFPIEEGTYWFPHSVAHKFEEFIESLETDLPVYIRLGSPDDCDTECAKALGITREQMRDSTFIKKWYENKPITPSDEEQT